MIEINQEIADFVELKYKNTGSDSFNIVKAKKVVCSSPINLIGKIDFTPHLPHFKKNFINSCRMGNYGKFIITYRKAFWQANGFSGEAVSDGSVTWTKNDNKQMPTIGPITCIFDATTYDDHAALVGFLAGDALVQWFGENL